MNGDDLRALLASGPLLSDGGMGTSLVDAGVAVGECFELFLVLLADLAREGLRPHRVEGDGRCDLPAQAAAQAVDAVGEDVGRRRLLAAPTSRPGSGRASSAVGGHVAVGLCSLPVVSFS